jgi:N-acetylglucosaminyldiphosphoundecaprenol N-acetyl-beta-D-mannosaminyltransferase
MFILGTKVHNLTLPQALKRTEGFLYDGKQHHIVTPNPEIVLKARNDCKYRAILNRADLSIPDGIGLVWASKILYGKKSLKTRVAGADFMREFLCAANGINVLLLGGRNGAAKKAAINLGENFQNIKFYDLENTQNAHRDFLINEMYKPDCVFVGLGAPKQERWIVQNLSRYPTIKFAMGVGGSLDFISGHVPRAPFWMRACGTEWFWRLAIEPKRAHRVFNAVIIFPVLVLKEKFWK